MSCNDGHNEGYDSEETEGAIDDMEPTIDTSVYGLYIVATSLVDKFKKANIGSIHFVQHLNHELNWILEENDRVRQIMEDPEVEKPDSLNYKAIGQLVEEIQQQAQEAKRHVRLAALEAFTPGNVTQVYGPRFEVSLFSLYLKICQLRRSCSSQH